MKIPTKADLILWGVLAACIVGLGIVVNHWRLDSGRLKVERTERKVEQEAFAARVSDLEERVAIEIENTRKANEVSNHYQARNTELEAARADTPARTVRLCHGAASAAVPATASGATAGGHHAARSEGLPDSPGQHPRNGRGGVGDYDPWSEDGPDIGPVLYALADEADRCASQRDALMEWISGR